MKINQIKKAIESAIVRSWESPEFKNEFVSNPYEVFNKEFGLVIDEDVAKIVVQDQTNPKYVYINIPAKIEIDSLELSDEELEEVSGGDLFGGIAAALTVGYAAYRIGTRAVDAYKEAAAKRKLNSQ